MVDGDEMTDRLDWVQARLAAVTAGRAAAIFLFALAGRDVAVYRDRLEASTENHPLYTGQRLALGLRTVPEVSVFGAVAVALLAVVSLLIHLNCGRTVWSMTSEEPIGRGLTPPARRGVTCGLPSQ